MLSTGDTMTDEEMQEHFPNLKTKARVLVLCRDRMWRRCDEGWECLDDGSDRAS
jgi:hypothetical protein